jgi:hypothetical protein
VVKRSLLWAWALIGVPAIYAVAAAFAGMSLSRFPNSRLPTISLIAVLVVSIGSGLKALQVAVHVDAGRIRKIALALAYVGGMYVVCMMVGFVAMLGLVAYGGLPSETSLRKEFSGNKDTLVELLNMQLEDSRLVRIAPSFTRLDTDWSWPRQNIGIEPDRWERYRKLFIKGNVTDGIQFDHGYVFYFVASVGLAIGGTSRGFAYTKLVPTVVVDHLDNCPKQEGACFVQLEPNWYIFNWSN